MKKICINTIRRLPGIEEIIKKCAGFGRTWGNKGSPLNGSHIAFINEDEVVIIRQDRSGQEISILEFKKGETALGKEIKKVLQKEISSE